MVSPSRRSARAYLSGFQTRSMRPDDCHSHGWVYASGAGGVGGIIRRQQGATTCILNGNIIVFRLFPQTIPHPGADHPGSCWPQLGVPDVTAWQYRGYPRFCRCHPLLPSACLL